VLRPLLPFWTELAFGWISNWSSQPSMPIGSVFRNIQTEIAAIMQRPRRNPVNSRNQNRSLSGQTSINWNGHASHITGHVARQEEDDIGNFLGL